MLDVTEVCTLKFQSKICNYCMWPVFPSVLNIYSVILEFMLILDLSDTCIPTERVTVSLKGLIVGVGVSWSQLHVRFTLVNPSSSSSFIFFPWIRTGLQNPYGYGN